MTDMLGEGKRARKPEFLMPPGSVHDHFDGEAHCVQCGGPCQLTGAELVVSKLVRQAFEVAAHNRRSLAIGTRFLMEEIGIDVEAFMRRAKEASS